MVIQIRYTHPADGLVEQELSYQDEPFTVGRSEDCTVCLPPSELSRLALVIEEPEEKRLRIKGGQRFGYVLVTRADGVRKATLDLDEELICGAGTYQVLLRTTAEDLLTVEVRVSEKQRIIEPGALTMGLWSRHQVFDPTPEDDWRWLAVLAAVATQTKARRKGDALKSLAKAWHAGDWHANLQGKLDKVLQQLGHPPGSDKLDAIANEVLSSGVVQAADYLAFRDEVQRRALSYLSRAEIGLLGWGYLARGDRK
jgi:hypothetical protein